METISIIFYSLFLFVSEFIYIKIADKLNIIDKPNFRSSHTIPTIRGGGIVFILGAIMFSVCNQLAYPYLLLGLLLIAIISFWDDLGEVSRKLRFFTHLIAMLLLLFQIDLFHWSWYFIPIIIVLIGVINAYNFMDGINGMTGMYSLSILIPLWLTEPNPITKQFIGIIIISLLVFLFYNSRIKARCFAGDIGSVGMALIIIFFVLQRVILSGNLAIIFVVIIYGIDSILTIIERLMMHENIFEAHRKHLYQLLANEYKMPHLLVSLLYALIQFGMNVLILQYSFTFIELIIINSFIAIIYLIGKRYLKRKMTQQKL